MHGWKVTLLSVFMIGTLAASVSANAQAPSYSILDLGSLTATGNSQAYGISYNGTYTAGRYGGSAAQTATIWNNGTVQTLANPTGRLFSSAYSVNDAGTAVGVSATTSFGTGSIPVIWSGGTVRPLALQSGASGGTAYSINNVGMVVGSVGSGTAERATIWDTAGNASYITTTLSDGTYMRTAFSINNAGLIVGNGVNPNNLSVNVGLVYDSVSGVMTSVGALTGANGALAYGTSNNGFVVGSSMLNQGSGRPYVWSAGGGITAIPLTTGTVSGMAYAVNDAGMVVGNSAGRYAVPFLYQDGTTYRLQDLIASDNGWNLSTNTSSSARGISADGSIVGTGVYNGNVHAFKMVLNAVAPVPEPTNWAMMLGGVGLVGGALRRRKTQMAFA